MTWKEKLSKMALVDMLNLLRYNQQVCIRGLLTMEHKEEFCQERDCYGCISALLDEEIKSQDK